MNKGNPAAGIVRRPQLRPKKRTPLEDRILWWLYRWGSADGVNQIAEAMGIKSGNAWHAVAALLERRDVVVLEGRIVPVKR